MRRYILSLILFILAFGVAKADVGFAQAVLSNLPTDPTTITSTDIIVGGTDIANYEYRFFYNSNPMERLNIRRSAIFPIGTNLRLSGLPEGRHALFVIGYDNFGVAVPETEYRWLVDFTGPQIITTDVVVPAVASNDTTPELILGIGDAGVGTANANVRFSCDNATWTDFELFQTIKNNFNVNSGVNGCGASDGEKYIYVQGRDSLGNLGASSRVGPFIISTVIPRGVILNNLPANPTRNRNISVTVSGDGITHYKYKLGLNDYGAETSVVTPIVLSDLSNGTQEISVLGRDVAGNYAALPATYTWAIADGIYPSAAFFGISQSTSTTGIGVVTVNFQLYDETVGVPMTLEQFEYSTDGGTTWAAPVNGDASTSLGNVWRIRPSLLVSQSPVSDSKYSFTWSTRSSDLVGLYGVDQDDVKIRFKVNNDTTDSSFIESANFRVDNLAPGSVILGTPPINPTSSRTTDIVVGGADIVTYNYRYYLGVVPYTERRLSGVPVATHLQLTNLPEGLHILFVTGFDAFGNSSMATEYRWTVNFAAEPPPVITVTAVLSNTPSNPTTSNSVDITVGGSGVDFYRYKLARTAAEVAALALADFGVETPVATHIILSGLEVGNYYLVVIGRSTAGTYPSVANATVINWTVSSPTDGGTNPPSGDTTPPSNNTGGGGGGGGYGGGYGGGGGGGGFYSSLGKVLGVKTVKFKNGTVLKLKGMRRYFLMRGSKRVAISYIDFRKKYSKRKVYEVDMKTLAQIPLLKLKKTKKSPPKSPVSIAPPQAALLPAQTFIEIAYARVRIRSGIGYGAAILTVATKGQKFEVIEEKQGWYKIRYGSAASAWIEGKWVRKR